MSMSVNGIQHSLGVPQLACCPLTGVKLVTIPPQPILYQTSKENISACSHTLALQHTYGAFEVSIRWAIQQSHHPTSMHSNNSGSFLHSLQLDKRLKLVHHWKQCHVAILVGQMYHNYSNHNSTTTYHVHLYQLESPNINTHNTYIHHNSTKNKLCFLAKAQFICMVLNIYVQQSTVRSK